MYSVVLSCRTASTVRDERKVRHLLSRRILTRENSRPLSDNEALSLFLFVVLPLTRPTLVSWHISHCSNLGHLTASASRPTVSGLYARHYVKDVVPTAIYGPALISYYCG